MTQVFFPNLQCQYNDKKNACSTIFNTLQKDHRRINFSIVRFRQPSVSTPASTEARAQNWAGLNVKFDYLKKKRNKIRKIE